jgi:prepilin-type N-terminal cleavage/methylation domain-containing protein
MRERPIKMAGRLRRGFTLIEMLVLIIIIAVLSSIAVPNYSRFHASMKFKQSVRSVVGLLQYTRQSAVQNNADATLGYDPRSGSFHVVVDVPDPGQDQPAALQDSPESTAAPAVYQTTLGEDVVVQNFEVLDPGTGQLVSQSGEGPQITFHDDGTCDGARIVLASSQGQQEEVDVWPTTGRATVVGEENQNGAH